MKQIKINEEATITTEEGFELEIKDGVVTIKKKEPKEKEWEEFGAVKGCYVDDEADIIDYEDTVSCSHNKNTFPDKKSANAHGVAMPQLLQWRNRVIGDWEADYNNSGQDKYCINRHGNDLEVVPFSLAYEDLSFPTEEIAKQFLQDHRTLLMERFGLK